MAQVGNKQNSILNGEWAAHVRKSRGWIRKRDTSKRRRLQGKKTISTRLQEMS